jgi:hypothetical protein
MQFDSYTLFYYDQCPYPGWRLKDGDLVTIEPRLVPTLFPPGTAKANAPVDNQEEDGDEKKEEVQKKPKKKTASDPSVPLEFKASPYMAPWMFIPAYLEVDYNTTSVVFLRSPLPQPNKVEIPSPFPPNWHQWTYDWYTMQKQKKKRIRVKPPIVINDRLVKLKPKFDRVFRRIRDARMHARRELRV